MRNKKKELVPVAIERLKKEDDFRIYTIFEYLGPTGKQAAPLLFSRLTSYNYNHIKYAAEALGHIGFTNEKDLEKLLEFIKDENPMLQADVIRTIGNWGLKSGKAVPQLCNLIKAKDWRVRRNSAYALGKMSPSEKSISCLIEAMNYSVAGSRLCIEAIRALKNIGPPAKKAVPLIKNPPNHCVSEGMDYEIESALLAITRNRE